MTATITSARPSALPGEVLRNRGFRKLFISSAVSLIGSRVTTVALPLVAITMLNASAAEVGTLTAAGTVAFLLAGLPAGAWIDRMRKRRVLIAADCSRAAVILTIPVAWWLGALTIGQLYVVAFTHGIFTVFFDVAYQSYVPHVAGRDRLVAGNARLQTVESGATVVAPTIAGSVIEVAGAASAMVVDTLSFLWSALALRSMTDTEPPTEYRPRGRLQMDELLAGVRFVFADRGLRAIAGCTATYNLFYSAQTAMLMLLMARGLGFSAGIIGLFGTIGAIGSLAGALSVTRLTGRLGRHTSIMLAAAVSGIASLLVTMIGHGWWFWLAGAGQLVMTFGMVVYNVGQLSLRQARCPDHLLGRMNATMRFLVWGTLPLGGLVGAALGTAIGSRDTMLTAATGMSVAFLWLVFSPLRREGKDSDDTAAR